jgi:hypothetical protein
MTQSQFEDNAETLAHHNNHTFLKNLHLLTMAFKNAHLNSKWKHAFVTILVNVNVCSQCLTPNDKRRW